MNLHYLKGKKESIPVVLLGAAAVFGVMIVIKATSFFDASARAENLVKMAVTRDELNAEGARESTAASEAIAEELKKRNLFSPPQPPRHPVTSVLGILGDEALIGDKWYRAGDTIGDAKIVAIEPTQVRIQWQGRETVFVPMELAEQLDAGGAESTRRDFRQANQDQASGQEDAGPVSGGRAERSRTTKIAKVPERDKAKSHTKMDTKQKLLAEEKQYQKLLKQDIKGPKKETAAGKKTRSDAISRKKEAAAEIKKWARKSSP
jgi:hypothetical protein